MVKRQPHKKVGGQELSPADIRRIRERLGLTQVEAGELLGGGPRAFTKYESGVIKPAASVVNLLRLLEASPKNLRDLAGDRNVPLDSVPLKPFEVTPEHVRVLSPKKFALLVERLLLAEALSHGLSLDGLHVAAQITVGDGGEDGRLEWQGSPDRTPFIGNRLSQFQFKATSIGAAAAGKDVLTKQGDIKPLIKDVLTAGGQYVMLMSHPAVKQSMQAHETAIRNSLRSAGLSFEDSQIAVRDAAQIALWVNAHPSVAVWLLEQTQPGLAGPFRDWSHWAGRSEHDSSPWVEDPRLDPFQAALRKLISDSHAEFPSVVRILGPAGIGKSRLTLEALGPEIGEGISQSGLHVLVLYAAEPEVGTNALTASVQNLVDAGRRAIVVVDSCDPQTHEILVGMVKRANSRVSLVTIDQGSLANASSPSGTLVLTQAPKPVVEGIIRNLRPNLRTLEQERLARFAGGYPQAARLIAESWEDSPALVSNDALIDRALIGRGSANPEKLVQAAMLLSAFGHVGWMYPRDSEITSLVALVGVPTEDELRSCFDDLLRRGLAQPRGRLLSLQPLPISLPLALRRWQQWDRKTWDYVFAELPNSELRKRAARQLSLLNREKFSADVVRHVCRLNGPFGSIEKLEEECVTEVLSSLAEVDAVAVVSLFEHLIEPLDLNAVKMIKGEIRRHLVWALEKIAFRENTFERAARLLLVLAAAENERYSNNATGCFKDLFSVFGAGTAAGPELRLQMLDEAVNDKTYTNLVVEALLSAIDLTGTFRVIGAELHGARPALSSWEPQVLQEAWNYVKDCMTRLAGFATRDSDAFRRARSGLGRDLRSLVGHGLIDDVDQAVRDVISQSGSYWPEALDSLGDILVYDADAYKPEDKNRVQALIELLKPSDIAARVRFLVTEMPWDYPVDEKLDFPERERRQLADVEALAVELLQSPSDLESFIPILSQYPQRQSVAFGESLARHAVDALALLGAIVEAYSATAENTRDAGLLGGFLKGLAARNREAVEAFKNMASTSRTFAPTLPWICGLVGLQASDVGLVLDALGAELLEPRHVQQWECGGVLQALKPSEFVPLLDRLLRAGREGYFIALDLLLMYVHGRRELLEEFKPQLRLVASNAGYSLNSPLAHMDDYHFVELMQWILSKDRSDADASEIALILSRLIATDGGDVARALTKSLLPMLLKGFPEIVWPLIGQAIIDDRKYAWQMQFALGDNLAMQERRPAILDLPEEVMLAWCSAHPDKGPAFIAGILPFLSSRDARSSDLSVHPRLIWLLDEFGNRRDILDALTANIHTFGWAGSPADYYALFDAPLRSLETHRHGALRRWASDMRLRMAEGVSNARDEDEERRADWGE